MHSPLYTRNTVLIESLLGSYLEHTLCISATVTCFFLWSCQVKDLIILLIIHFFFGVTAHGIFLICTVL